MGPHLLALRDMHAVVVAAVGLPLSEGVEDDAASSAGTDDKVVNNAAMKIAVVGGGAMGLLHAALLARVADVSLVVRREEQAKAIQARGCKVQAPGGSQQLIEVPAWAAPAPLAEAELVLVAVKSYATEQVASMLAASAHPDAMVVSVQNGLAHNEVYARACGVARVLLGSSDYGAARADDTTVVMTVERSTVFGESDGSMTERVLRLQGLFRAAGMNAEASPHARSVVWSKFAQACCQNALSAITGLPFTGLYERDGARRMLTELAEEMKMLAAAEGVALLFDPETQLLLNWKTLRHKSSMLQDLEAERRTEIEALNGEAVRRGNAVGLPMHANRALWHLIRAVEPAH